jgi:hypothetical protein
VFLATAFSFNGKETIMEQISVIAVLSDGETWDYFENIVVLEVPTNELLFDEKNTIKKALAK